MRKSLVGYLQGFETRTCINGKLIFIGYVPLQVEAKLYKGDVLEVAIRPVERKVKHHARTK